MVAEPVSVVRLPASAWLLLLPALLVPVAASAADSISTPCIGGACPMHGDGELTGDDVQLLQLRGVAEAEAGPEHVQCTYSGTMCAGNQCCPRASETDDKTYPCPSADEGWNGCEGSAPPAPPPGPPAPPPVKRYALFVIGSNNKGQAAQRMGLDVKNLKDKRAYLAGYQREFRGLSTGRSYGAVCTPIPAEGKKLKGVVLFFDNESTKGVEDCRGKWRKAGNNTLELMDTCEGVPSQYERTEMNITYYTSKGKPRKIEAWVYRLIKDRRIVMGNGNQLYKDSLTSGNFPNGYYNNGMVSKGYIDAVLDMLLDYWGRTRISAAEDFPPAQWTQACRQLRNGTYVDCAKPGYVVMFDDGLCKNRGEVKGGQRKGACNITGQPGRPPAPEMFNKKVIKYDVNDYVPDRMLVEMESVVMGPPKPPSMR